MYIEALSEAELRNIYLFVIFLTIRNFHLNYRIISSTIYIGTVVSVNY